MNAIKLKIREFLHRFKLYMTVRSTYSCSMYSRKFLKNIEFSNEKTIEWRDMPNQVGLNSKFEINLEESGKFPAYILIMNHGTNLVEMYGKTTSKNIYSLATITNGNKTFNEQLLIRMYNEHMKLKKYAAFQPQM